VPTSLINTRALLIEVNEEPFAVPGTVLEQILTPGSGEYQEIAGKLSYHWRHNAYPVSPLAALLHRPYAPVTAGTEDPRSVLLVRAEAAVYAVPVDGVRDSRDLVIKDLGHYLQRVRGVSGASILGDGRVVPILDLPELLRVPLTGTQLGRVNAEVMEPPPVIPSLPRALIVEDSLSVRRALASLLEDSYEVMAARDGLEALERLAEQRPDILLVDLEMPRMDGIELTRWVRTNATTQDVPVIMITSRSMEKHRQLAQQAGVNRYFVKPYGEQQLLDEMANLVVSA
jgi:CheY-like chemotaxis protein